MRLNEAKVVVEKNNCVYNVWFAGTLSSAPPYRIRRIRRFGYDEDDLKDWTDLDQNSTEGAEVAEIARAMFALGGGEKYPKT